jgi:hypothetical protein
MLKEYTFKKVKYSCGHIGENVSRRSVRCYEPAVLNGMEKEDCPDCIKEKRMRSDMLEKTAIDKAKSYLSEKGINPETAQFSTINQNTEVEITLYFKVAE